MMENITAVHNKTAIITGGARGIGKEIVKDLASQGYNVIINYNSSRQEAIELENSLKNKGVSCLAIKCDISKEDEINDMVHTVLSHFGKIDLLVNNAAVCKDATFYDRTAEDFRSTFETNVIGTFLISRIVGEIMYRGDGGKIINLTSTNGINTYYPMCIDYDASKSAIISLTHNLATQFAPKVIVNAIAPGFIATDSEISGMDEEFMKIEESKIMVERAGKPEEVAGLVSFLASPKGDFINNQVIKINGGIYGDF